MGVHRPVKRWQLFQSQMIVSWTVMVIWRGRGAMRGKIVGKMTGLDYRSRGGAKNDS